MLHDKLRQLHEAGVHTEEDAKGYRLTRGRAWTWVSVRDLDSTDDVLALADTLFWMPQTETTGKFPPIPS